MEKLTNTDYERITSKLVRAADRQGEFQIVYETDGCDLSIAGRLETLCRDSLGDGISTPREWIGRNEIVIYCFEVRRSDGTPGETGFDPSRLTGSLRPVRVRGPTGEIKTEGSGHMCPEPSCNPKLKSN